MLVPVHGKQNEVNALQLNKRRRQAPAVMAALATLKAPPIYIFNIWHRPWGEGAQRIPACKPGKPYSKPLVIEAMVIQDMDLGDGAGNMGVTTDPGMEVANSMIGANAGTDMEVMEEAGGIPGGIFSTDKRWFGVFATHNEIPAEEELAQARSRLTRMMEAVYTDGAEKVEQNQPVHLLSRRNYNDAARFLGRAPLWGNQEHTMDRCAFCKEPIVAGAIKCRHCNSRLDTKEAKELMGLSEPPTT